MFVAFVPAPPPPPSRLWIIGAVIGGILGVILIGWIILFVYFKCTRQPSKAVTPRSPRMAGNPDAEFKEIKVNSLNLFIYLFIYCHLYSAFSIVQCSNALYRL